MSELLASIALLCQEPGSGAAHNIQRDIRSDELVCQIELIECSKRDPANVRDLRDCVLERNKRLLK